MNKNIGRKHKHLTLEDRIKIQEMLGQSAHFKTIATELGKDPSTISKEVRHHLRIREQTCILRDSSGKERKELCPKLSRPPYVCNACKHRHACRLQKHYYEARSAQKEYQTLLRDAREGIPLTKESFYQIDAIISQGVKQGQHLYHIVKTNQLPVSLSTLYRHLEKGYLSISPLDLPRKVKFKPRKQPPTSYVPKSIRVGRTYEDFLAFLSQNHLSTYLEMDTVIGRPGGKVIMTWDFTFCNFMVAFLLDSKTALAVAQSFTQIKTRFQQQDLSFGSMIPVILTDNGGEFSKVDAIENDLNGIQETHLFFCRPMQSSDKPHVEKNHTLFRDICPKGSSFDSFTQEDVSLMFSHINSIARKRLNGKTPYDLFSFTYGENIASLLGIQKIPPREVIQSPLLLKNLGSRDS